MQVITERQARESYDEMLDECYPEVVLGYSTFSPSDVLRTMDPTCYEMGFTEYVDNMADDEVFLVEGYTDDREVDVDCDDSDDGYALASAGYGTDEDYGYAGDEY